MGGLYKNAIANTIQAQVYNIIKEQILEGTFKEGTRLHEVEIAKDLNVSRSPVRESLKILDGERLVESIPNKGIFVKKVDKKDIIDAFEIRILVENYSIAKITRNAGTDELEIFESLLKELTISHQSRDFDRYNLYDAELHNTIVSLSRNDLLIDVNERIFNIAHRLRRKSLTNEARWQASLLEHTELVHALLSKDEYTSCAWNNIHLNNAMKCVISLLE